MNIVIRILNRWLDQDVARANAAQAAVRLLHDRRNRNDVEAWLTRHPATPNPAHRRRAKTPGSLQEHSAGH